MFLPAHRSHYVSDNGISLIKFPFVFASGISAAIFGGWFLQAALAIDMYIVFLLPCLCGLLLGGVLYVLLNWARCRNVALGVMIGVSFGTTTYLSNFAFDMLARLPAPACYHLELLPLHIHWRMTSDAVVDVNHIERDAQGREIEPPPSPYWKNWLVFALELAACAGIPAIMCFECSRRVYDAKSNRWLGTIQTCLPAFSSSAILATLGTDQFSKVVAPLQSAMEAILADKLRRMQPTTMLTLHYADFSSTPLEHPAYLTIADYKEKPNQDFQFRDVEYKKIRLSNEELLAIRPWFPTFAKKLAACYPSLAHIEPLTDNSNEKCSVDQKPIDNDSSVDRGAIFAGDFAEITQLPPVDQGQLRTIGFRVSTWLLNHIYGLMYASVFAVAIGCADTILHINKPESSGFTTAAVLMAMMFVVLIIAKAINLWRWYVPAETLTERWLRQVIRRRPESLVDHRAEKSFMVTTVRREPARDGRLLQVVDYGLLQVDRTGTTLNIEGDQQRYRIPLESMSDYGFEAIPAPIDQSMHLWLISFSITTSTGSQELFILPRDTSWFPTNRTRLSRLVELSQYLATYLPSDGEPVASTSELLSV